MRKELGEEKSHRADARVIAVSEYPAYRDRSRRFKRWLRDPKAPAPIMRGIGYRAVLRTVGGHALYGATCYRVRATVGTRVVLSVRTPEDIKVKSVQAAQVALTKAGAVLRTEVNRAIVLDAQGRVGTVRSGEPLPAGLVAAFTKGMAVRAKVAGRTVVGVVTGLKSRGSVVVSDGRRTVEATPRRLERLAPARPVLLLPDS